MRTRSREHKAFAKCPIDISGRKHMFLAIRNTALYRTPSWDPKHHVLFKLSRNFWVFILSPVLSTLPHSILRPREEQSPSQASSFSQRIDALLISSKSCLTATPPSAPLRRVCWWLEREDSKSMTPNSHLLRNPLSPQRSGKYSNCHVYVSRNVRTWRYFQKKSKVIYSINSWVTPKCRVLSQKQKGILIPTAFPW